MYKKAYIFFANGFEEIEALTPVDVLRRAGVKTVMVSVTGKENVTGSHDITIQTDCLFEQTNFDDADMLILPGGAGTETLFKHEKLKDLLIEHSQKDTFITAICAAPKVLGNIGLLNGKKATCYPGVESFLTGAHFIAAPVVEDGKIITARGAGASIEFALTLVKNLFDSQTAHNLAAKLMAV